MLSSALQKLVGLDYASGIENLNAVFRIARYTDYATRTRSSG